MASIEYTLFRIKFIRPRQLSFFHDALTSSQLLLQAIAEKPSAEAKRGYQWHLGNVKLFSKSSGYFAVGRTTHSTVEKFDTSTGNFVEEELEHSPYTHCVFEAALGILGIAKKTSLAPNSLGIAKRLQELFGNTEVVRRNSVTVEILPVSDPDGFLKSLHSAYRVITFTASFRRPNPFDADEYFQRPLSVYLSAAQGTRGKTTISGDDLDREVLHEVTRSTAATGNEASARIQQNQNEKPVTVHLSGNYVTRQYPEEEHDLRQVLTDLANEYERIRYDSNSRDNIS